MKDTELNAWDVSQKVKEFANELGIEVEMDVEDMLMTGTQSKVLLVRDMLDEWKVDDVDLQTEIDELKANVIETFYTALAGYETEEEEAAWLFYSEAGKVLGAIEVHLTSDEDSPTGHGWYFSIYELDDNKLVEEDGGMYWGYVKASDLLDDIKHPNSATKVGADPVKTNYADAMEIIQEL